MPSINKTTSAGEGRSHAPQGIKPVRPPNLTQSPCWHAHASGTRSGAGAAARLEFRGPRGRHSQSTRPSHLRRGCAPPQHCQTLVATPPSAERITTCHRPASRIRREGTAGQARGKAQQNAAVTNATHTRFVSHSCQNRCVRPASGRSRLGGMLSWPRQLTPLTKQGTHARSRRPGHAAYVVTGPRPTNTHGGSRPAEAQSPPGCRTPGIRAHLRS